eukprot:Selendium_serpulae@DN5469_c0_g1_i2.p1
MPPKKKEVKEERTLLGRPSNTLKMGLVGLPNVGKSTTFNLLSKQSVPAENFPFCTIEPHEARMHVPDDRFNWLCEHFVPKNKIPAFLTIFDIAGLVPGAHKGEGIGNAFLANIMAVDGIYHVVRAFADEEIVHSQGEVHPLNDLETISDELRLKDVERAERVVADLEKVANRTKTKKTQMDVDSAKKILDHLSTQKLWITKGTWTNHDVDIINENSFLTAKPVVYLVNMSETDYLTKKNKWGGKIAKWVMENLPGPIVPFSAALELKLADMESDEERAKYLKEKAPEGGAASSCLAKIIETGYSELQLIHFFTVGEDEVKCWTIRSGTKAPQAAGTIHTDFEKHFVCAEVYKYADLIEQGTVAKVRATGKIGSRGKDYVIENGDIINFKVNVTSGGGKKK